jgi:RNA polymerase primary sigma factor
MLLHQYSSRGGDPQLPQTTRHGWQGVIGETGAEDYIRAIKTTDLLTAEQEQELAAAVQAGEEPAATEARNELVRRNLRLAAHEARKFIGRGIDYEDLVQAANEGLMTAASKYEMGRGRFTTYAVWWVRHNLQIEVANHALTVRIPVWAKTVLIDRDYKGRAPVAGVKSGALLDAERAAAGTVSFEQVIFASKGSSDLLLADVLADEGAADPEQEAIRQSDVAQVQALLQVLDERERKVAIMRHVHELTWHDIGRRMGLSHEGARLIALAAVRKMRQAGERMRLLESCG